MRAMHCMRLVDCMRQPMKLEYFLDCPIIAKEETINEVGTMYEKGYSGIEWFIKN